MQALRGTDIIASAAGTFGNIDFSFQKMTFLEKT
jgi:hypothetical protein